MVVAKVPLVTSSVVPSKAVEFILLDPSRRLVTPCLSRRRFLNLVRELDVMSLLSLIRSSGKEVGSVATFNDPWGFQIIVILMDTRLEVLGDAFLWVTQKHPICNPYRLYAWSCTASLPPNLQNIWPTSNQKGF